MTDDDRLVRLADAVARIDAMRQARAVRASQVFGSTEADLLAHEMDALESAADELRGLPSPTPDPVAAAAVDVADHVVAIIAEAGAVALQSEAEFGELSKRVARYLAAKEGV